MKPYLTMEKLVNLAKGRGFVYPGSEIYGGLENSWDYGPLGIELKNNIKDAWWKHFVNKRFDMVGLDAAILMNPKVWEASGHVGGFSDPLINCKACNARHRADKLIENDADKKGEEIVADGWSAEKTQTYMMENNIVCPDCGELDWGEVKHFNLMFKTKQGVNEDSSADIYLRPETAQGIFVNFENIQRTTRKKVPFGVGQVGKAFRNEITPGNFIFRTREFEQMEIEFFVKPGTEKEWQAKWEEEMWNFLHNILKVNERDSFRLRWHNSDELSHYSNGTFDFEYQFPFGGWSELWGCASRTDFDLKQHQRFSGKDENHKNKSWDTLKYIDPDTNEKYHPYVVEPTFGLTRTLLMILSDAYYEEELEDGSSRTVLKFAPVLAPTKVAILPLVKKLSSEAMEVYEKLSSHFTCDFDEAGAIGRRYRRQDEVGTPWCVTVDFDTTGTGTDSDALLKGTVTVRDRDTMEQKRMGLDEFIAFAEGELRI